MSADLHDDEELGAEDSEALICLRRAGLLRSAADEIESLLRSQSHESAAGATVAAGTERFNVPGVLRMLEAEAAHRRSFAAFTGERTKIELVARLIRKQQEEIERLTSVADAEMKLREGNFATIERLQRALAFWLPGVPTDDPEVARRAGDDAYLLAGYQGDDEPSAEERGWISLREAP